MIGQDALDDRFIPICEAFDAAKEPFDLLAGENIFLLTLLLIGSINDAPEDIRGTVREHIVDALNRKQGAGERLKGLCLRGEVSR